MKCLNCFKEMGEDEQFCGNCGEKREVEFEPSEITKVAKECAKVFFVLGYSRAKSTKEQIEKYEDDLRKNNSFLKEWYSEAVAHLEEVKREEGKG